MSKHSLDLDYFPLLVIGCLIIFPFIIAGALIYQIAEFIWEAVAEIFKDPS